MGLRAANKPLLDSEGFALGLVVKSEFNTAKQEIRVSKDDIDVREYERYELTLLVTGTVKDIQISLFAGSVLNDAIEYKGVKKIPVYNRLTSLALSLDIVETDELKNSIDAEIVKRVEKSLLDLAGKKLKFKLGKFEGKALTVPVANTFKFTD